MEELEIVSILSWRKFVLRNGNGNGNGVGGGDVPSSIQEFSQRRIYDIVFPLLKVQQIGLVHTAPPASQGFVWSFLKRTKSTAKGLQKYPLSMFFLRPVCKTWPKQDATVPCLQLKLQCADLQWRGHQNYSLSCSKVMIRLKCLKRGNRKSCKLVWGGEEASVPLTEELTIITS